MSPANVGHPAEFSKGLAGVVAGETAISSLDDSLRYRGYPIDQLAAGSFEETAFLLLRGELPDERELAVFAAEIATAAASLDAAVSEALALLARREPAASVMDALRSGVSILGQIERDDGPETGRGADADAMRQAATRLIGQTAAILATWVDLVAGREVDLWPEGRLAESLLARLTRRRPSAEQAAAFDTTLVLYAEHEFNASTFAARTVASTGSDMHSAVVAAIGALKGPLHGGANEQVLDSLLAIGSPERAEAWVESMLAAKKVVMGFGHRVYKDGDERARLLGPLCRQLGEARFEAIAATVEAVMLERKGLKPNLDWPAARIYQALGLHRSVFTPIFVVSRMSGWTAHVIEQAGNNRLIRPLSRYVGRPPREAQPLSERPSAGGRTD
jgi:citrate synthase